MHVVVQVSEEVAGALKGISTPTNKSLELTEVTERFGFSLTPLSPGMNDPLSSTLFDAEVPDRDTAVHLVAELRGCAAVETAYIKPPDEMPR